MREKILEICRNVDPSVDYTLDNLIDGGLLDSSNLVELVSELMDAFDIEIPYEDVVPENFNSIDAITGVVEKYV